MESANGSDLESRLSSLKLRHRLYSGCSVALMALCLTFVGLTVVRYHFTEAFSIIHHKHMLKQQELTSSISDYQQKIVHRLELIDYKDEQVLQHLAIRIENNSMNTIRSIDLSNTTLQNFRNWRLPEATTLSLADCRGLSSVSNLNFLKLEVFNLSKIFYYFSGGTYMARFQSCNCPQLSQLVTGQGM